MKHRHQNYKEGEEEMEEKEELQQAPPQGVTTPQESNQRGVYNPEKGCDNHPCPEPHLSPGNSVAKESLSHETKKKDYPSPPRQRKTSSAKEEGLGDVEKRQKEEKASPIGMKQSDQPAERGLSHEVDHPLIAPLYPVIPVKAEKEPCD